MHPTRNDLALETRSRVIELLNARLADAIDLHLQAKQAHWNVKGPAFIALHELFDRLAGDVDGHVDGMAERIAALGGVAEGTLQAVAGRSRLDAYPLDLAEGRAHLGADHPARVPLARGGRRAADPDGLLRPAPARGGAA